MPSHEEHCQDSYARYGKRFDDLHSWMDEPWEVLGKYHRMYRHDPFATPSEARKLFGEMADHACLDHILLDMRVSPERFEELKNDRRGEPEGICPLCGATLVWRRARITGELYRGCTNYKGGCRWHDRSYRSSKEKEQLEEKKQASPYRAIDYNLLEGPGSEPDDFEILRVEREEEEEERTKKSRCFIATAAFGTPMANEIDVLRRWRDNVLMKNKVGKVLVNIYYVVSPAIASYISKSSLRRYLVRQMLQPIISSIEKFF